MTRLLLAILSWLVPRSERPRWREEWLAEIRSIREHGGWWPSLRAAAGALPDAVAVRRLDESPRRRLRPFSGIGHDFRDARRRIAASPSSSAGIVASLVLGIAVTSSAFALLHTVMFRGYPGIEDQDSLVRLTVARGCGYKGIECWIRSSSLNDHSVLQEGLPTLAGLTTRVDTSVAIRTATEPHAVRAALVSPNYFPVLGFVRHSDAHLTRPKDPRRTRTSRSSAIASGSAPSPRLPTYSASSSRSQAVLCRSSA